MKPYRRNEKLFIYTQTNRIWLLGAPGKHKPPMPVTFLGYLKNTEGEPIEMVETINKQIRQILRREGHYLGRPPIHLGFHLINTETRELTMVRERPEDEEGIIIHEMVGDPNVVSRIVYAD